MKKFFFKYIPFGNLLFSKTAKNTYFVTIGNGIAMVFGFIFILTLIRSLSLADFGYFSAIYAVLLLVTDVADIGISASLSRFIPPFRNDKQGELSFLKSAFLLQIIIAVLASIGVGLFSPIIGQIIFHMHTYDGMFWVAALGIVSAVISNFFFFTLAARQRFLVASLYMISGSTIRLFLLIPILVTSTITVENSIWIQSISLLFLALFGFIIVEPSFLFVKRTSGDLKKLLAFTSYLGAARSITAIAGKLDVIMLVSLASATEAGIFSTASRVIAIYPLLAGSFSTVIAPKLAYLNGKKELYKLMFKVIIGTLGLIGTIIILIILGRPFMGILFAEKGFISASVFQILLVSMIFFVASIPAVSLAIYYLHKPQILTVNSILQVIIVIAGNFYFIPKFGRFGPAVSLILAYGVTLVLTSYLTFRTLKKKLK